MKKEIFVSIDIEAGGPILGDYSMSSLGACLIENPETDFYLELKPISEKFDPETASISGLDRNNLILNGIDAQIAMQQFADWIETYYGTDAKPIFVGFNVPYDWMFVHWYFEHFLGPYKDPFGFSGWDIKAYYAGVAKKRFWADTSMKKMKEFLPIDLPPLTHNALDDARQQAKIFRFLYYKNNSDIQP